LNDHYIKMYKEIGMLLSLIPGKILERDATRNELYDTLAKIEEIKIREAGKIAMKSDNYTGKDKKEFLTLVALENNQEYQTILNETMPSIRLALSNKEAELYALQNKLSALTVASQTVNRMDNNTALMIMALLLDEQPIKEPAQEEQKTIEAPPTLHITVSENEEEIEVCYDEPTTPEPQRVILDNVVTLPTANQPEEEQLTGNFIVLEARKTRGMGTTRAYCENVETKKRIAIFADNPAGMILKSSINKMVSITYIPINGDGKAVTVEEISLN